MEYKKTLSASSVKSFETCSWLFYQQYILKAPQRSNEGAQRGTCVHSVFELLINKRHRKHHDVIMEAGNIDGSPAIRRIVIKYLRKDKILTTTNYDLINDMIMVGLRHDFFGTEDKGKVGEPEYRFEIVSDNPRYKLRGVIDKIIFYRNGKIKIVDYKSSKQKFKSEELDANVQAMAYTLAGYKLLGAKDVATEFMFLRFPRQPVQQVHPTKEQLDGFEQYLAYIYELINNFNIKLAHSNMAAFDKKNSWLCKAGKWECPYLNGFTYYALFNEDGSVARTSMKNDLQAQPKQKLKVLKYEGCPAHKKTNRLSP